MFSRRALNKSSTYLYGSQCHYFNVNKSSHWRCYHFKMLPKQEYWASCYRLDWISFHVKTISQGAPRNISRKWELIKVNLVVLLHLHQQLFTTIPWRRTKYYGTKSSETTVAELYSCKISNKLCSNDTMSSCTKAHTKAHDYE